jgi:hypothetical protein
MLTARDTTSAEVRSEAVDRSAIRTLAQSINDVVKAADQGGRE